jgi:Ca-activated chloride channel family protein
MITATDIRMGILSLVVGVAALAPGVARPDRVVLTTGLGTPLMVAGKGATAYLKIGVVGSKPARRERRAPIDMAIVLDRSGSMSGEKLARAREAAQRMVERLDSNDIVSIVTFDSTVQVLVPATRLSDRAAVIRAIASIGPGGDTALFGGMAKGAAEVRKFKDRETINRVVLLSDGQANVGPSTPRELAELGASLKKEGITVSTIGLGLGYNEDLMVQLAQSSDGNHAFVEKPSDLDRVFRLELGDLASVVAKDVELRVDCAASIRPVRVLGREATIDGQSVYATISQLYAEQEAALVLEVEVSPGKASESREVARVQVEFLDLETRKAGRCLQTVTVRFTGSEGEVASAADSKVMASAVELVAAEASKVALSLRDQGKVAAARDLLWKNAAYLEESARRYRSSELEKYGAVQRFDASNLGPANWEVQRKAMRKWQQINREAARR